MSVNQWGSDVPVSMPQALPDGLESMVPMGGFTMTVNGLYHDLNQAEQEALARPTYAPRDPAMAVQETAFEPEQDREWT